VSSPHGCHHITVPCGLLRSRPCQATLFIESVPLRQHNWLSPESCVLVCGCCVGPSASGECACTLACLLRLLRAVGWRASVCLCVLLCCAFAWRCASLVVCSLSVAWLLPFHPVIRHSRLTLQDVALSRNVPCAAFRVAFESGMHLVSFVRSLLG
jgi:hypothetical protein